jgi:hypothetical protein
VLAAEGRAHLADRTPHWGTPPAALPGWAALARLARREGHLSTAESTLLAAAPAGLLAV